MKKAFADLKYGNQLIYAGQLEFKKWAQQKGASKKNGADFYFDFVTGVDAKTGKDIKGLKADGSMTWSKALEVVKKHFRIKV